jgi:polysaccharide biosynthesis transport protein
MWVYTSHPEICGNTRRESGSGGTHKTMTNMEMNNDFLAPAAGPACGEAVEVFSESLFRVLGRRRWTVLGTAVLAVAGGFLYLHCTTPLYTSTSKICVEQAGPQIFEKDTSGLISMWDRYLYTQAARLQSTQILAAALQAPETAMLKTWANARDPMTVMRRNLEVVVGKKDEIITVSFVSPYPEEAAYIVNAIIGSYITAHEQRTRSTLGEVVRILKEEKTRRNEDLLSKLQKMAEFKQQNEALALGTQQDNNVVVRQLESLASALQVAQLATLESKSFYDAARKTANEPYGLRQLVEGQRARGIYATTSSESTSLRTELNRMERDKAELLRELKPNHPTVKALDAEIQRTQRRLTALEEEFARGVLTAAEQQYLAAREKEEELQKHFEEQRQEAVQLNKQLTQYTLLQSDYDQAMKLCDLLDSNIQRLDVTTEVGALNISVLEAAEPALRPSRPQKARTAGAALTLGLVAGVGLALLRDRRDQRLRSAQEISTVLSLPVLGVVPSIRGPKQIPSARGQRIQTSPDSQEAEAFRAIRTAIFFGTPKGEARTILITSPAPREGKSTVVANLGIAMAQAGQRTLVLDADFRRPMQHKIFGIERKAKDLSLILAGKMAPEDAIVHTDVENLDVLTCGPDVPNPAEMLNSDRFARLVHTLSSEYDRVLIDSPPVVTVTDSHILGALCHATILVLRAEFSTRRVAAHARDGLVSVGARVLGVVVNDVSDGDGQYGYYTSYGHSYRDRGDGGNGRHKTGQSPKHETAPTVTAGVRRSPGEVEEEAGATAPSEYLTSALRRGRADGGAVLAAGPSSSGEAH